MKAEGWTLGSLADSGNFTADLSEALKSIFQSTLRKEKNYYTWFMTRQGFYGHPDLILIKDWGPLLGRSTVWDSADVERWMTPVTQVCEAKAVGPAECQNQGESCGCTMHSVVSQGRPCLPIDIHGI